MKYPGNDAAYAGTAGVSPARRETRALRGYAGETPAVPARSCSNCFTTYLLLLLAINFTVVSAQQPDVVRINTDLVQTAVTVLDKKGNFVERLQREQFELIVDGNFADFTIR